MLRKEKNTNHGYTTMLYISALENGLVSIYQPVQPLQQNSSQICNAKLTKEWQERHGVWVVG